MIFEHNIHFCIGYFQKILLRTYTGCLENLPENVLKFFNCSKMIIWDLSCHSMTSEMWSVLLRFMDLKRQYDNWNSLLCSWNHLLDTVKWDDFLLEYSISILEMRYSVRVQNICIDLPIGSGSVDLFQRNHRFHRHP